MAGSRELARMISNQCVALRLRSAARVMTRAYDQELREVGLRLSQLTVVVGAAMFGEPGAAMNELAEALAMDRTTLTRNLKPLIDQGVLRAMPDEADRRSRRIVLTKKGEQLLARAYPAWQRAQAGAEAALEGRVPALGTALDQVLARIKPSGADDEL